MSACQNPKFRTAHCPVFRQDAEGGAWMANLTLFNVF